MSLLPSNKNLVSSCELWVGVRGKWGVCGECRRGLVGAGIWQETKGRGRPLDCCYSAFYCTNPLSSILHIVSIELTRKLLQASIATDNFHQLPLDSGEASVFGQFWSEMSSVTAKPSKCEAFLTSEDLHNWLSTWPTVSAQLKLVVIGLRRRQVNET